MESIEERLNKLEDKIDAVYTSTEKTRKYLLMILISSIVMVVLPIIIAALMLPMAISTFGSMYTL